MSDRQEIADLEELARLPGFVRFIGRMVDACGVIAASAATDDRLSFIEGRRSVGLLLIQELARAGVEAEPDARFRAALIQVLTRQVQDLAIKPSRKSPLRYDDADDDQL